MDFQLSTTYKPQGDQPRAIAELISGIHAGEKDQVLLGVTGSGKTFTMAKVIEELQRPALILAHNKTLAAQLYHEFKTFFPNNAVEYFVSYYDYYQPEAYIPAGDLFIEKESTINEELDKLRLSATRSLFERRDAIIVSSVSCIYGLGSPEAYYGMLLLLEKGQKIKREDITRRLDSHAGQHSPGGIANHSGDRSLGCPLREQTGGDQPVRRDHESGSHSIGLPLATKMRDDYH